MKRRRGVFYDNDKEYIFYSFKLTDHDKTYQPTDNSRVFVKTGKTTPDKIMLVYLSDLWFENCI